MTERSPYVLSVLRPEVVLMILFLCMSNEYSHKHIAVIQYLLFFLVVKPLVLCVSDSDVSSLLQKKPKVI